MMPNFCLLTVLKTSSQEECGLMSNQAPRHEHPKDNEGYQNETSASEVNVTFVEEANLLLPIRITVLQLHAGPKFLSYIIGSH